MRVPAVAGVDHARLGPGIDHQRRPARTMAHDERVDAHRGDRLDRVAQALALAEARLRHGERHRVGRQPLGGGLEAEAGARRVLEEHAAHRLATQRRHLRVGAAVHLGHVVGEVENPDDAVGAEVVDGEQRSRGGHEIDHPVGGCRRRPRRCSSAGSCRRSPAGSAVPGARDRPAPPVGPPCGRP